MKTVDRLPVPSAVALAVSLLISSEAAWSQAAPAAPAAEAPSVSEGPARILVTAQKRPQFAEQVPMSLSAIPADQLERQGVTDYTDLGRLSPGLSVNASNSTGQLNIAIRGVSSQAGAATTAIYVDDAAIQTRSLSSLLGGNAFPELFDLERVEVLRGPQGTLFGSSAQGGAIRFITPMPRKAETSGEFRIGAGVTQGGAPSYETGLAVGGGVGEGDDLLFRVSLGTRHEGGYMKRVDRDTGAVVDTKTNSRDGTVARAALQWRPISDLTIAPSIMAQQTDDADRNLYYVDAGLFKTYNKIRQPTHDRFSLSALSVSYDTERVTFKSVTSFYDRKQRRIDDASYTNGALYLGDEVAPGLPDYVATNRMTTAQRNIAQEFRVSSNDDAKSASSWVAGLYFARARTTAEQATEEDFNRFTQAAFGADADQLPDLFSGGPVGPNKQYSYLESDRLQDRSAAVFGEYTHKLGASTTATLGLRVGRNEYTFSSLQQGPFAPGGLNLVQGRQRDTSVLPKLSVSQEISPTDMVYATAASGDRPGGGNPDLSGYVACAPDLAAIGVSRVPAGYKSDKLWSYELGYKGRLLDQSMELAASLFYINWQDIQTRIVLPICGFGYIANAGRATSAGADMQLQWRLSRSFNLSATASYTDAQYRKTVYANGSSSGAGSPIIREGQSLPAPRVGATLGVEYAWTPLAGQRAYLRSDYQYASSYKRTGAEGAFDYDAGLYEAPATHYVSLNTGLRFGAYDLSATVQNLLNAHPELLRTHYAVNSGSFQATTYRPRTLVLNLSYKF